MNQSPGDARGAIGRTASARAREGSVPETNRETCPTARAIVCREMDGMRTVVVPRWHPAACERAPFVQSRRPRNPPGDSRGRTGRNLPRDATGPGRLVEETRGQGQVEKGSRQGNRGRRDDLGGDCEREAPSSGFALYEVTGIGGNEGSNGIIPTEASVAVFELLASTSWLSRKSCPTRDVPRYVRVWLFHRGPNDS